MRVRFSDRLLFGPFWIFSPTCVHTLVLRQVKREKCGLLAQVDRALVSGTKGHRFESCIAHHSGLENKKVGKCDGEPPVCSSRALTQRENASKNTGWSNAVFLILIQPLRFNIPPFAFLFRIPQISLRAYAPPADSNFLPAAFFHHQSFHPSILQKGCCIGIL